MDEQYNLHRLGEWTIQPAGNSALSIELPQQLNLTINQCIHGLASAIDAARLDGLVELVPGYCTLLLHYVQEPPIMTKYVPRLCDYWMRQPARPA